MNTSNNKNEIFPIGEKAQADYFTGNAWVKPLISANDMYNISVANVVFEAGARNNWHTHAGGQILIVTDGEGYYQEKDKPIQMIKRGDVIQIAPDVIHWHGASHESAMTHIAINTHTEKGVVDWLEPVTDEEYNGK